MGLLIGAAVAGVGVAILKSGLEIRENNKNDPTQSKGATATTPQNTIDELKDLLKQYQQVASHAAKNNNPGIQKKLEALRNQINELRDANISTPTENKASTQAAPTDKSTNNTATARQDVANPSANNTTTATQNASNSGTQGLSTHAKILRNNAHGPQVAKLIEQFETLGKSAFTTHVSESIQAADNTTANSGAPSIPHTQQNNGDQNTSSTTKGTAAKTNDPAQVTENTNSRSFGK